MSTKWDLNNKTVLITGATDGLGKATAKALAKYNATLIIPARNLEKAENTKNELMRINPELKVDIYTMDLSSLKSVQKCANEVNKNYDQIHVLINNAGLIAADKKITEDGFEFSFQVNHIGHFLLTNLLLDKIKTSAPSRIINISSTGHNIHNYDLEKSFTGENFARIRTYGAGKLANIFFTNVLAEKLKDSNITVNAVHPGPVNTNFMSSVENTFLGLIFKPLSKFFFLTPEEGAKTQIYLAESDAVSEITGKYWAKSQETPTSELAQNMDEAQKLWDKSVEAVKTFI